MSIHASNNSFPCGGPAGPGTDLPPVANTYETISELIDNQSNQEVGFLYRVNNGQGFESTRLGEVVVELKSKNGLITDYKAVYIKFPIDYQPASSMSTIPLHEGNYAVSSLGNISLNTNAISFEDDSIYLYKSSSYFVKRQLSKVTGYIDYIYDSKLRYVGYRYYDFSQTPYITNVILDDDIFPNNHYSEILLVSQNIGTSDQFGNNIPPENAPITQTENLRIGKISKTLKISDYLTDGLIKIPYLDKVAIVDYKVYISDKIAECDIVQVADSQNNEIKTCLRLKGGYSTKEKSLNQELYFEFKYYDDFEDFNNQLATIKPITSKPSALNNVFNADVNLTHNNQMITWFNEFYDTVSGGDTPPTITGFENSSLTTSFKNNYYRLDAAYVNDVELTMSASSASVDYFKNNDNDKDFFKIVSLGNNNLIRLDRTTAEDDFLADVVMVTSRAETDNDGTDPKGSSYGFGVEFNEPTRDADLTAIGLTIQSGLDKHQQSPATAIVTAKFKWLRNETGAPWGLIREACRATASNAGSYNIYRGFGKIDANAAKTYIENNIDTWTGVNTTELAEYYDAISPYNTAVTLEEKTDKTPMTKGDYINDKAYISGRMGTAMNDPASPNILKFNEFWSDSGDIVYTNADGKFTFNKAGLYTVSFNGLTNSTSNRITLMRNTTTSSNSTNIGNGYATGIYQSINIYTTYYFEEGDFIVFSLSGGALRNVASDKFNEFSIIKIA